MGTGRFEHFGYEENSPFKLVGRGRQVRLGKHWASVLSEPWKTDWENYDPEGDIDLECTALRVRRREVEADARREVLEQRFVHVPQVSLPARPAHEAG